MKYERKYLVKADRIELNERSGIGGYEGCRGGVEENDFLLGTRQFTSYDQHDRSI